MGLLLIKPAEVMLFYTGTDNLHFNLPQQIHNLLRLVPLVWHDWSSSSGEFSLISPGTENPGQVSAFLKSA
jgi:hypothetical protein